MKLLRSTRPVAAILALLSATARTTDAFSVVGGIGFAGPASSDAGLLGLSDRSRARMLQPKTRTALFAEETQADEQREEVKPDILDPFPEAADPMYKCRGPVGEGDFIVERTGGPRAEELTNENVLRILKIECSDLEVNTLLWKCLGYRFDAEKETWTNEACFPKWKEKYPEPPDLIGMQRIYSREVDQPSLRANQSLVRSVPVESKQSLKKFLKPLGFRGYKYAELTPNKTRRAQCANWLLYYREELFGYTVEELKERRRMKLEKEEQERIAKLKALGDGESAEEEWKPPVREVY